MNRVACYGLALCLAACAGRPPAPIEDLSGQSGRGAVPPGHYRVGSGDTLYAIAFGHGLDYRALADWNDLRPPYTIYPGQDLRLTAPAVPRPVSRREAGTKSSAATPDPANRPTAPVQAKTGSPAPVKSTSKQPTAAPKTSTSTVTKSATPKPEPQASTAPTGWLWPVKGRIIRGFSPTDPSRDGIDIAGREGDPIRASAAGTVVYSGNGLIGYGELVIVKHNDRWLSAYGHNRKRLVAEGETVKAGQTIAEMGRNDRNEQVVHFEIRSNGRPVNPLDHLPSR